MTDDERDHLNKVAGDLGLRPACRAMAHADELRCAAEWLRLVGRAKAEQQERDRMRDDDD
jgi:hypothetical protein